MIGKNLNQKKKKRERQTHRSDNCYLSLFSWFQGQTILLSALAGPLILILIGFTVGPSIFNCKTNYISVQ